MSPSRQFLDLVRQHSGKDCLVWQDRRVSFSEVLALAHRMEEAGLPKGAVVAIEGGFSPAGVAALLAILSAGAIAVPVATISQTKKAEYFETAQVECSITINQKDEWSIRKTCSRADHELIVQLRESGHPGLVLFSSGSTGRSKAVVHDLELLLLKYLTPRHSLTTVAFLLFDHIGGLDTLFYNLANGSCLVTLPDHAPDTVCAAVEKFAVEVLPVSPTFLNLMLLNGAHSRHDMSSLKVITFGAEVMPDTTLQRVKEEFPHVRLLQKFGTTEVGTLRSQSRESGSPWMKIGGNGYETRIVNGLLEIKAESAMLGYLNSASPFTEDGWFMTGDAVQADGDFMRVLGRSSEIINVGGEKVHPAEVEDVLMQMPGILDVTVIGEPNPLTGNIVTATVNLAEEEAPGDFRRRMRVFCHGRLASYKIPARVHIVKTEQFSVRHKKLRLRQGNE